MAQSISQTHTQTRRTEVALPVDPSEGLTHRLEKRLTVIITVIPFLAAIIAVPVLWNRGISLIDVSIATFMYLFSGFGITIGFHRYLTHRGFKAKQWVRGAFAVAGSFAIQGTVIKWVADHRRHHAFSDRPGDPHSPHTEEASGIKGVLKGLWHAHIGWFFDRTMTDTKRWAPDLEKDPLIQKISRLTPLWIVLSFAIPPVVGLALTQSWYGALTALLWGSLVRVFFLHHITWSINSICHFFGKKPFEVNDESRNNWLLSVISFGEAWHNNHHAFPTSAVHGVERGQYDPGYALIRLMERFGLIWDVKKPSEAELETKRRYPA